MGPHGNRVLCSVPSHPKFLPLVRSVVTQGSVLAGFDEDLTHRIVLAVTEAMTNVIRHAYGNRTDRRIDLELGVEPERLRIDLIDYGTFVDPKVICSRPLEDVRPGGLGVHLIKSTMDHVEYLENDHGGTTLRMVKHAAAKQESS